MEQELDDTMTSEADDRFWQAVCEKDRGADGSFVFAVASTGIYCRPSCPARTPLRRNVRFFQSGDQAAAAGFRPCRRCSPETATREEEAVASVLAVIRTSHEVVPLSELAEQAGYSPAHLQKIFKRAVGMSPAAYGRALRLERAGDSLSDGASVTDAVYEAGYGAPSRFYDASRERMGMAPSAWRDGGRGVTIRWARVDTSLGRMLVAATDKGICRLSFGEGPEALACRFPHAELQEGGPQFEVLLADVITAVERPGGSNSIPLDVKGTAFQEAVWEQLRRIPPGETRSYAQIAAAIGKPRAVRAAGSANGANHVAVLIPCHRVVRSDGSLGGYAYGTGIKSELLRRESET